MKCKQMRRISALRKGAVFLSIAVCLAAGSSAAHAGQIEEDVSVIGGEEDAKETPPDTGQSPGQNADQVAGQDSVQSQEKNTGKGTETDTGSKPKRSAESGAGQGQERDAGQSRKQSAKGSSADRSRTQGADQSSRSQNSDQENKAVPDNSTISENTFHIPKTEQKQDAPETNAMSEKSAVPELMKRSEAAEAENAEPENAESENAGEEDIEVSAQKTTDGGILDILMLAAAGALSVFGAYRLHQKR